MKTSFNKLDKKVQLRRCTSPHYVSPAQNPDDEKSGDFGVIQEKLLTLSDPIQDILTSPKTGEMVHAIGKKFNLNFLKTAGIARLVRAYYFGELPEGQFTSALMRDPGVDQNVATQIANLVLQKIINAPAGTFALTASTDATSGTNQTQVQSSAVQLPLTQALTQFQGVNDQVVTSIPVEIRGRNDLAPGTVKNWVYDYRDNLGAGKHSAMERGNYLFNSKNTKRLEPRDRHILALVLKSLDENTLLTIDTQSSKIIFEQAPAATQGRPAPQTQNTPAPHMQPVSQPRVPQPVKPVQKTRTQMQTQTPKPTRDAFRSLHHETLLASTPQSDVAFSSKQKLPVENMAKNVRQKMQNEHTPPTPPTQQVKKPLPGKKKKRRNAFNMRPIE